jgi:formylmethanofuran:tetrahydromethanopterin formyltransferase
MQNNLETSIDEIKIYRENAALYLDVKERDEIHRMEIGLYEYKETVLDFRGEKYIVKAIGEASREPDGSMTYRVELIYPELPNILMIKLKKTLKDRIAVSMAEIPNGDIVDSMATRLADSHSSVALIMNTLDNKFGADVIRDRLEKTFAPTFIAADKSTPGYEIVVADEEAVAQEESALGRMIKNVVQRYIKYDEDGDGRPDFNIRSLFSDLADKLKFKKIYKNNFKKNDDK